MRHRRSLLRIFFSEEDSLLLVFFAFLAAVTGLATAKNSIDAYRLANEGASAVANVVDLRTESRDDSPSYFVHYAFLNEGEWVTKIESVPQSYFDSLHEEDKVPVRFWTKDPILSKIEETWTGSDMAEGLFLTAGFSAFALVGLLFAWNRTSLVAWLERNAVPVQARVARHVVCRDGKEFGGRAIWCGPNGETGATSFKSRDELPPIGSMITILTDPSGKRESLWEGDV